MGVTEILFSFRLVQEGKIGEEMPESSRLEFLEKFSVNNFLYQMQNNLWTIEERKYSRFTFLENTIGNLLEVLRAKFLESDGLVCFINMQVWQLQEASCNNF